MKPRVFVSSVIDGFEEYRAAARRGIIEAGGDPVLIEDYPGLPVSPRNACLDAVENSDIFIILIGQRGGWTAPSGKPVVEEELTEARRLKLPVLGFIQKVDRDKDAENLVRKLSDYIDGLYRLTFTSPEDMVTAIEKTLKSVIKNIDAPEVDKKVFEEKIRNPIDIYGQAAIRFVLSPERSDEFIDPVSLDEPEIEDILYKIGHSPQVRLFSYRIPKEKKEVTSSQLVLFQTSERSSPGIFEVVRLEVLTTGSIIIDMNVTGQRSNGIEYSMSCYMSITEEDIAVGLNRCFAFSKVFYDEKDPYKRYDRMMYNVALNGISTRTLLPKPEERNSYQIPFNQKDCVVAFDIPRIISRTELDSFKKQIDDTLVMLKRQLNNRR